MSGTHIFTAQAKDKQITSRDIEFFQKSNPLLDIVSVIPVKYSQGVENGKNIMFLKEVVIICKQAQFVDHGSIDDVKKQLTKEGKIYGYD